MFAVRVEVDLSKVRDLVDGHEKQVRFATAVALTRTAWDVAGAEKAEVGKVFDRPTPQTLAAFRVDKATKDNLTAVVSAKNRSQGLPADEYLQANIVAGQRAMKRSELMLQAAGILPSGYQTAPGVGAKLDSYGNMTRGQIAQILSYFQTYGVTVLNSPRMNMSAKKTASLNKKGGYFVVAVNGAKTRLAPGIWMRDASRTSIKPVLMFIKPPAYKKRFDFDATGDKQVQLVFKDRFDQALDEAMRTAR